MEPINARERTLSNEQIDEPGKLCNLFKGRVTLWFAATCVDEHAVGNHKLLRLQKMLHHCVPDKDFKKEAPCDDMLSSS